MLSWQHFGRSFVHLTFLIGAASLVSFSISDRVFSQNITLDGSLGPERSLTGPTYTIQQADGLTVGSNLFHSFGQFNLQVGEIARFQSDASILNILSRVTGGTPSLIDGLIQTESRNVNLFLMNPKGIVFGPSARLDVGGATRGSFVATTFDAIAFSNGAQFSATHFNSDAGLLTVVGDPSGFLATQRSPAEINSFGSRLQVRPGQSLLLLGGNINLDNSSLSVRLSEGGRIELGGLSEPGQVNLAIQGNQLSLVFPDNVARSDIFLRNRSELYATSASGGNIAVHARNLELSGASQISGGIFFFLGNETSRAGDIAISATDSVVVTQSSRIENQVNFLAKGTSGNITLTTNLLSLLDGGHISTGVSGKGTAGNIGITAHKAILIDGDSLDGANSGIFSTVNSGGVGKGGNITLNTKLLSVARGGAIQAGTFGQGDGGNVLIQADVATFDGIGRTKFASGAFSEAGNAQNYAIGNAGNITVRVNSLYLANGAAVSSTSSGKGNAGNVTIQATDTVWFDGTALGLFSTGAFTSVERGEGNSGNILLTTRSLNLTNGAALGAGVRGTGNGGDVTIKADTVWIDGVGQHGFSSGAFSTLEPNAIGRGGNVIVEVGSLKLTNGGVLSTSTFGTGNAGNIIVQARDTVKIDGVGDNGLASGAFSSIGDRATGTGGNITVNTGSLDITNGGVLSTSTFGTGNSGNVTVQAKGTVRIDGVGQTGFASGAFSTLERNAIGRGGNVTIEADSLYLTNGGVLNTSTFGFGDSGNISIRARDSLWIDGIGRNDFASGAFSVVGENAIGVGGNVTVDARALYLFNGGALSASTFGFGNSGNVSIQARDTVWIDGTGSKTLSSGVFSIVGIQGFGTGGNVTVNTGSLYLTNGGLLSSSTFGVGNSGSVTVRARDEIVVDGIGQNGLSGGIFSRVAPRAVGQGGNIDVSGRSIAITGGAGVFSESSGFGNPGNIQLTASETIRLKSSSVDSSDRSIFGNVQPFGSLTIGRVKGGDITLQAREISLDDAFISAIAGGFQGRGGDIRLIASDSISLTNGSSIFTRAIPIFTGIGGDITLQTNNLLLAGGSRLSTSTFSLLDLVDQSTINRAALEDLRIILGITDQTRRAGNLSITANSARLDGGSVIESESTSGDGGNINLMVRDLLLLRRGSLISTTAGTKQAGGDGGNITIQAGFIVAVPNENSDIIANAFTGRGGNIRITAQGIFGTQFRLQQTPESDITASSTLGISGLVDINTLNVDPNRGLVTLPTDLGDATHLIAQSCAPKTADSANSFFATGRGGIPPSPTDPLQDQTAIATWVDLPTTDNPSLATKSSPLPVKQAKAPTSSTDIVEAQGWLKNRDGMIYLVASSGSQPGTPAFQPLSCFQ